MKQFKNVLMIAVDDLRPEINCFGKRKLHTPNLDRLASGGLQLDHAYCQIPLCMPSRASLMSGIRPDERQLSHIPRICVNGEPSLPGYLKQNGFTTISIGKVYHFNNDDEPSWTRRYRDTFYEKDYTCDGYCSGYQLEENKRRIRNFRKQWSPGDEPCELPAICESADAPESDYPDGMVADRAIEVMRTLRTDEGAFFLAVGFYRPHLPWAMPAKYWDLYQRDEVDLASNPFLPENGVGISDLSDFLHYGDEVINHTYSDLGRYDRDTFPVLSEDKQRECVHGYWASVSFTDAQIGKVLAELERLGLQDDTAIVLWGDNGWHLGEHRLWSKVSSFEESTRVPMIVSVPGVTTGERSSALVELADVYPTICELVGLDAPSHLEGTSLVPLVEDPQRSWKTGILSRIGDAETLRTDRYRFTRYSKATPDGDRQHLPGSGTFELFDLQSDPGENINVAEHPDFVEVVEEMDRLLTSGWRALVPDQDSRT
ncbi:MAG: sulfatase [Lentisphaerae bacterium]|jgi:iduronate 2-sulfatase|nr:sulfatase [Lentisphaerota bacterium]MBT4814983.1 sulfatase [Lentisphaerota bacterium]MBT5611866.1 sulfatase [Lentisphaerota bacterium]MBT7845925.1 sulfatase [Lentisphaerota bacterium]